MIRAALLLLLSLAAGCGTTADRAPEVWYPEAEVVCYVPACEACGGKGHVACGPCRGGGQVKCRRCVSGLRRCTRCKGDGSYKGAPCKRCRGKGKVVCPTCGGDSRVACERCAGKGRLHHLRPIRITEPKPEGEDVWPPAPAPGP